MEKRKKIFLSPMNTLLTYNFSYVVLDNPRCAISYKHDKRTICHYVSYGHSCGDSFSNYIQANNKLKSRKKNQ